MNKYTLSALSVLSGVLSGLAWTDWCPGLVLLAGFVPLFFVENHLYKNPKRYAPNASFLYFMPGFVIFSILTLGWIRVISMTAAVCVILIASFLMSFTLFLVHKVRMTSGPVAGIVSLIAFWLSLEFLCLRIPVLSPWIILGNGLSKDILFIQWYEITGTAGGTIWILLSNLSLFLFLKSLSAKNRKRLTYLIVWISILIVPSVVSLIRYETIKISSDQPEEVVIVQPDFDPYGEKFTIPFETQLRKVIDMAEPVVSENTDWLVTPETTIDDPADENRLEENQYIKTIRAFVRTRQSISFVTGIASFISSGERTGSGLPADHNSYFNSAFKIDTGSVIAISHKSKLVPGFEYIPSKGFRSLISRFLPEPGGKNRGYSTTGPGICFSNSKGSRKIAPVICYESVYGQYVADLIKKGAGAIFIITNDGWWKNTNGYKQHLSFASLRAIETRRPVVRSANTGISCFIDIRGKILRKTEWWIPAVIVGTFSYEDRITPYVRFGDYLMYMACLVSLLTLLTIFIFRFTERNNL
jgi:apolipoprotein N-acyltransferase